ncbi:MAG: response regulator transcription factor [Chitinophagaceae bacterium]
MKRIKVILADDHDILMDGIESILNDAPHIEVAGKASSADKAELLIEKLQPDLLLTDISMGAVSGLELTKRIAHRFPLIRIIVLTMHDDAQNISSMLEAGATGYLLKNVKQAELLAAIDNVMAGRQYIQQSLVGAYSRSSSKKSAPKQGQLTPREIEIIRLIAQELTTAAISRQLFLSEHTVETHRKNIWRKTGVKTVVGLLNFAREQGLL